MSLFLTGKRADSALAHAESIDAYRSAVLASPLNERATRKERYVPIKYLEPECIDALDNALGVLEMPDEIYGVPLPRGRLVFLDICDLQFRPHTRPPDLIVLPKFMLAASIHRFGEVVLHERMHLSQRAYPHHWTRLAKSLLDFWPTRKGPPDWLLKRVRLNPDTYTAPWFAWRHNWIPLRIFDSTSRPQLNKSHLVWWQLHPPALVKVFRQRTGLESLAVHPRTIIRGKFWRIA